MITPEMFKKGKFWTDAWSLVDGCTPVSEGCRNCWLKAMQDRFGHGQGDFEGNAIFRKDRLYQPNIYKKPRVFAIWSDLYHEGVNDGKIIEALQVMRDNQFHIYLIITKRIERAVKFWQRFKNLHRYLSRGNIYHIVTAENQARADERIPHLLRIPGKRGIIIEPMLGAVSLTDETKPWGLQVDNSIHQVILGPENGKGKRPFKEEWAESVRAQCEGAGVPFYRKDKGEGELVWRGDG